METQRAHVRHVSVFSTAEPDRFVMCIVDVFMPLSVTCERIILDLLLTYKGNLTASHFMTVRVILLMNSSIGYVHSRKQI